jgi:hypothetical protein
MRNTISYQRAFIAYITSLGHINTSLSIHFFAKYSITGVQLYKAIRKIQTDELPHNFSIRKGIVASSVNSTPK